MIKEFIERLKQGHQTTSYPDKYPGVYPRYRGTPKIDSSKCADNCNACVEVCPTDAIAYDGGVKIDLGKCLFCVDCERACPEGAIKYTQDLYCCANKREGLVVGDEGMKLASPMEEKLAKLYRGSFGIRQVSAGGDMGDEAECNATQNIVFDTTRFGIHIVASPRHADALLVTGPVSENMKLALEKTYKAVPKPTIVIACGTCAISGGPFRGHPEQHNGIGDIVPVDLYIPGFPPHPITILDGLLRLLGYPEVAGLSGEATRA
ncbi:MAG: 4Fe-4S dicluster domain-containing protein [Nitrospinales bacterium]